MPVRAIIRTVPLNLLAAASGMLGTIYITWAFGPAVFAVYIINIAKLALVMLGLEMLPASFGIFRSQEDAQFKSSMPIFYIAFSLIAALFVTFLILIGVVQEYSWFMLGYVILNAYVRYFDCHLQAEGQAAVFLRIPPTSNTIRLICLIALTEAGFGFAIADVLWGALVAGMLISQIAAVMRTPALLTSIRNSVRVSSAQYLWRLKSNYFPYYPNAILRSVRDASIPLFCDAFMADKRELGRFFLFQRAMEFAAGQIKTIEAFLTNRRARAAMASRRVPIMVVAAVLGQIATVAVALVLHYREGIDRTTVLQAIAVSFFLWPYVVELFRRTNAYADFSPGRVTMSMAVSLLATISSLSIVTMWGEINASTLILTLLIGQTLSAATYFVVTVLTRDSRNGR